MKKTTLSILLGLSFCLPSALPELASADSRSSVRRSARPKTTVQKRTSVRKTHRHGRHRPTAVKKVRRAHRRAHVRHRRVRHRHGFRHVRSVRPIRAHYHYGRSVPCYDGFHTTGVFWDVHWRLPVLDVHVHRGW